VLPYLPYSRQSKKKSHRGAITARLLANLLDVAGVKHIISVDLHASQMQGFFKCPIDNLNAEPLLARWIRQNVSDWKDGVVVSKNAGGTKRVTSLADALKLSFGIITTDKRRGINVAGSMTTSMIIGHAGGGLDGPLSLAALDCARRTAPYPATDDIREGDDAQATSDDHVPSTVPEETTPVQSAPPEAETSADSAQYNDHLVQDVTHGRLIQGRIVDDNFPSPGPSANTSQPDEDPMAMSHASSFFAPRGDSLGGSDNAGAISDEEEDVLRDPRVEHMITLVGDVRNRPVFIVDDMIDKPQSWIAAAETVVKRGYAKNVYCMATHGVFGGDCLQQLQACESIHTIVVTNSIPIDDAEVRNATKLVVLDLSFLLSEAIRRNHYGESISPLFQHINS
jgi:ribose-phosphate pyrophosphokinase